MHPRPETLNQGERPMSLSKDQAGEYEGNGFIIVEDLLAEDEVAVLRKRAELVATGQLAHISKERLQVEPEVAAGEAQAESYADSLRKMFHMAFYDEVFEAHARNPKVLDIIESILGPDFKLMQDQLFMKPPRIGSRQRYHQDQPAGFNIDPPDQMVTCWAALDNSTIENGCLWMLPGTHKLGPLEQSEREGYERKFHEGGLPDERPIVMKAGSCSFHHGLILHSSRVNLSDKRRRGYATHYVSARCRYTGQPEENDAMLVRGKSIPGCI